MKKEEKKFASVMYYINTYHELELKFHNNKISAYEFGIEMAKLVLAFKAMHKQEIDLAYADGSLMKHDEITRKVLDDYYESKF